MPAYYPVFLNLHGRRCVVVGGGEVAERKAKLLVESGARVRVVSPHLNKGLQQQASRGAVEVLARPFQPQDVEGAFLVIAATDDPQVNQSVAAAAEKRNLLVNVVDMPAQGNFIVPSMVRQDNLTIAISTGGHSPALARKLREELERSFVPEYAALLDLVSQVRRDLMARGSPVAPEVWQASLDGELLELVRRGEVELARQKLVASLGVRQP